MNSLLQTLHNLNAFRKAVYHMPTSPDDEPHASIALALQSLFFKLQFGPSAVPTKDLTRSFGWDSVDAFMQHDVQELNRVLCEKLEDKMKGTAVDDTVAKLFEGHTENFVRCINVECESTRKESFMDLQLDVKGCKDVYASFDAYTAVETLDGQNQYNAEGHGLQDAKKGVLFDDFPPVLQLQLKRFEYDFARDAMVKINDLYEFPEDLDLDVGDRKYLSKDSDAKVRNLYKVRVQKEKFFFFFFERPFFFAEKKLKNSKLTLFFLFSFSFSTPSTHFPSSTPSSSTPGESTEATTTPSSGPTASSGSASTTRE
jgi:ubiquitin carboxyl-terminal hydrolase 7